MLGAGLAAVLLAGFLTAYFLTRGSGDDGDTAAGQDDATAADAADADDAAATDGSEGDATETTAADAADASPALPPVVIFDEAAVGPVDAGVEYTVAVGDGPAGAQYQLLVDGEAQAEPAPQLPPVVFPAGRHLLVIDISSPEGSLSTDPVVIYAKGETPAASFRANLSSVDVANEGWGEAVAQFDQYVASGHTDLQLLPSDPYPSLAPGYWNLFVDGFETRDAAEAYCAGYDLAVPDQCYVLRFDPAASAAESG